MTKPIDLTQIQQVADKRSQSELKQISTSSERKEASRDLTEKVWPKLQAMYGYKFTSQFGEMPDSTWASCLMGITPRQIADGLNNCLEMHPEWPPGAAQFRAACLGKFMDAEGNDSSWSHNSMAYMSFDDEKHPEHKQYSKAKRIEHASTVSKRKQSGNNELNKLKDMF